MLVALLMGFSCGLPLLLTISLLQAWMRSQGVDLATIGLMALVGLPYTLKFLWAPLVDRYTLPFLGRRRGWLLVTQVLLAGAIVVLGFSEPAKAPTVLALVALLVTFFSASQDIVVDAYRREDLSDQELGLGSSLYVNGYRVGMLLASGGGMIMADHIGFTEVYMIMAAAMGVGIVTTLLCREPPHPGGTPVSLKQAVVDPFVEYFQRSGALGLLAFVLLYKIGDSMASTMTIPFYLDTGFSNSEIGAVVKLFGFWATVGGGLIGGVIILKLGIRRCLWIFGLLQAVSTAGFAALAYIGHQIWALAVVIAFENLASGMGTAAFLAFMATLTDKRFTATQYALLSSLIGVPRVVASAPTGWLAQAMGWPGFFIFCTLAAIPGLLLLLKYAPWSHDRAGNTPANA
ncbi:MAG: AmpG family muropeptide MFS transporter [Desulfarculaceae bacterium]|nr:AmpG family muropeptide MFS transporter [Desulfarculaceae bacterium]MCF8071871.1 AmpG family muropeptide MFS transporter [Desulfarculaceae bacterium]MCF8101421.1 AmpG family muropeptide MFS transporter [Desulfarculaceae bacterium]MCF8117412.1 AmpG family muropeptide MFS transporter [Desulfarculaceae bacterium]